MSRGAVAISWTSPRTFVVGEIVTASILNTHLRDQFRYLKGMDGVPTIQSGLIIDNSLGTEYLTVPSLTTTQRDALTPVNGMVIYNSTLTVFQRRENGAWISYNNLATMVIASQAQGDIFYAASATAIARLGAGTSGYVLRTQGPAANPIWDGTVLAYTEIASPPSQAGTASWTDFDLSASIPAGAKAVTLICANITNLVSEPGARKNGSASTKTFKDGGYATHTFVIELDALRIVEIIDGTANGTFYAMGYWQ